MWRLACELEHLDANSPYFYLMWCRDFAATSVVARDGRGGLCAFTVGFVRPESPSTLFVRQSAVARTWQGGGLASRMLERLVGDRYRYVECTITPGNMASDRYMSGFARRRGAALHREPFLGSEDFPDSGHEPEILYRIGPLNILTTGAATSSA
jgi:L-2,4-diaminobutyric acid acetyltransferase